MQMQPDTITHRAFFGDGERDFVLRTPQVLELERQSGVGIGVVFTRLRENQFSRSDVAETIRLGLIGGGCEPQEAASLIAAYVTDAPLGSNLLLAVEILHALWFGKTDEQNND